MARNRKIPPARTPEQRENQMINLAMDAAEKMISEGKASSQIITHFLKLGATRALYEVEKLKADTELAHMKAESVRKQERTDELYEEALNAFRSYQGDEYDNDEEYYD